MLRLLLILIPLLLSGCSSLLDTALSVRCGQSDECVEHGRCGVRTWRAGDRGWRCVVESSDDCAATKLCRTEGLCAYDPHLDPEACIAAEPAHCREADVCAQDGLCLPGAGGVCVTSERGCRASVVCAEDERCAPSNERVCIRAFADAVSWCDAPCEADGACERDGLVCRVVDDSACLVSTGCADHGRCHLDADLGVCSARSDADCQASSDCIAGLEDGTRLCTLRGGVCADARSFCERSKFCLFRGDCTALEGTCAPTDDSCAGTMDCLLRGHCQHENHLCLPMESAHCEDSLECQAFGRCELSSWLVQQCSDGGRGYSAPWNCAADACLSDGRCLQDGAGVCHRPEELGLEDDLPWWPVASEPPADPDPLPAVEGRGLVATVDGERVVFTHALWASRGGETQQVLLADSPVDCGQVDGASPYPEDATWVQLSIAPRLGPERKPGVSRAAWGRAENGISANAKGDLGVGSIAGGRVAFYVVHELMDSSLTLEGAMDVRACGELPTVTPPRPQEDLQVAVSGEPVPIAMALVDTVFDDDNLILSSQPVTCSWRHWQRGEPDLLVVVDADGRASVEGARVPGRIGVWGKQAPLVLGPTDANGLLDVSVDLNDPSSNPRLRVQGTVRAVDCRD